VSTVRGIGAAGPSKCVMSVVSSSWKYRSPFGAGLACALGPDFSDGFLSDTICVVVFGTPALVKSVLDESSWMGRISGRPWQSLICWRCQLVGGLLWLPSSKPWGPRPRSCAA